MELRKSRKTGIVCQVELFTCPPGVRYPRFRYEVGKTYWCKYWQYTYKVIELTGDGQIVVEHEDGTIVGHRTPLSVGDGIVVGFQVPAESVCCP